MEQGFESFANSSEQRINTIPLESDIVKPAFI